MSLLYFCCARGFVLYALEPYRLGKYVETINLHEPVMHQAKGITQVMNKPNISVDARTELIRKEQIMASDSIGIYKKSSYDNVFQRDGGVSTYFYSDGDDYEDRLAEIINNTEDIGTFSSSFSGEMSSWPIEYHLSRKRHLILRHLDFGEGHRVLELGAGCGAITRYLGETRANIVAVEGSRRRASIISSRCRDLSNVFVINDLIQDLDRESVGSFDFVLLIGVLEYSTKYLAESSDPFAEYLTLAKSFLRPGGCLVVAIENKLGLKYFNGASEDHNGLHFYGLEGRYKKGDVTTLGKLELISKIKRAGFDFYNLYSVFPDYKLPRLLLKECSDQYVDFRAEEIVAPLKSLDYSGANNRLFDESLVLGGFRKNGILSHFANSFLVLASENKINLPEPGNVFAYYYSPNRVPELCCLTKFIEDKGDIRVTKSRLQNAEDRKTLFIQLSSGTELILRHTISSEREYVKGESLLIPMIKAVRNSSMQDFIGLMIRWANFLAESYELRRVDQSKIGRGDLRGMSVADVQISGDTIDLNPTNIVDSHGKLIPIDDEWECVGFIPFGWVLLRGLGVVYSVAVINAHAVVKHIDLYQIILQNFGFNFSEKDIIFFQRVETEFGDQISRYERSDRAPIGFYKLR